SVRVLSGCCPWCTPFGCPMLGRRAAGAEAGQWTEAADLRGIDGVVTGLVMYRKRGKNEMTELIGTTHYRGRINIAIGLLVVLLLAVPVRGTRAAGNTNPGILPPESKPYGLTYAQWSVGWWQWALSIPTSDNPLLDQTGANCRAGQSGHVWYLAGLFNASGTVTRFCTVPVGTALFFPIFNIECDTTPPPIQLDQCPGLLAPIFAGITSLKGDIDGRAIDSLTTKSCPQVQGNVFVLGQPSYCVASEPYAVTLPANNLEGAPPGTYQAVNEGVYLLLTPLSAGTHTIHFAAPSVDITYRLTVTS
ncbi:MAG: hypothetical protein JWO59_3414, partial [Chloroflexi bacterium]|nr:hypothetical protein [Chloroflexota bacterium]